MRLGTENTPTKSQLNRIRIEGDTSDEFQGPQTLNVSEDPGHLTTVNACNISMTSEGIKVIQLHSRSENAKEWEYGGRLGKNRKQGRGD